jgi:CSLREA domain-containing protein
MKRRILISEIIVALLLLSGAPMMTQDTALAQSANAAGQTLVVTIYADSADGICDFHCSLREAVSIANQTPGADTITLFPGIFELTIPPESSGENYVEDEDNAISDLDISDHLTLVGVSVGTTTLASAMQDRVLQVLPGVEVRISDLTITGGDTDNNGGGLANAGSLTLENVHVSANVAGGYESGGSGGGIYNSGSLTIHTSRIVANSAGASGSGAGSGGGIANDGVLKLYDSLVADNWTTGGESFHIGGGITNGKGGEALISGSTIARNHTNSGGGGIANIAGGSLLVTNSTVSGNSSRSGAEYGGLEASAGIVNGLARQDFPGGVVTLLNVTISGNFGGGLYNRGEIHVANTIIAGNFAPEAEVSCRNLGIFTSLGHNIFDDKSACPNNGTTDQIVAQGSVFTTMLGPLADNGSPTPTHALLPGSVAIDAGEDAVCADAAVGGIDQRGVIRPQGAHCDIGAYERLESSACSYPELVAGDEATLRQAIECLNVAPSGAYTLTITADIVYSQPMFRLNNPALTSVLIAGNEHMLDASGHGRVLTLHNVQALTLRDLALVGGDAQVNALYSDGGGIAFDCTRDVLCHWTLVNTLIRNNQADAGGGIDYSCAAGGGGSLLVQDSVISNNQATTYGGGLVYRTDEDSQACSVTLRNTVVEGNQARMDGGGLRIFRPRVSLIDSTIRNNTAGQYGGGAMARISDGYIDMTILRSTIGSNHAGVSGGGFYIASPDQTFDINFVNSTISGNSSGMGGGLWLDETDGSLRIALINSTVTQNSTIKGAGGIQIFDRAEASAAYTSTLRLVNSIIAHNAGSDCAGELVYNAAPPAPAPIGYTKCADEGQRCSFIGTKDVAYGANDSFFYRRGVTDGIDCSNEVFGDPLYGVVKACYIKDSVVFMGQRVISFGHNLDSDGTCLPPEVRQASDIPNGNANLGPLADNGGPTLTHALLPGSQALNAGDNAVCAAAPVNGMDQRGVKRPQGAICDVGAYEREAAAPAASHLFVSSRSSASAGGVGFRDEDIVAYDLNTQSWQMVFDGSDLGVTKDVDAFVFLADGSLLLSFNAPTDVPGLGKVDDSDIVQFTPTQLGSATAGNFALYLRGADVGLTTDGEDIDAIGFTADGKLVVSTIGDFAVTNLTGKDEDLIRLDDKITSVWSFLLDGSTVGLANEDVNGLWIDPATGELYLTVKDSFAFSNVAIDSDDIFICTPTQEGACTYGFFWDSDSHDYGAENLDSIGLGVLPASFVPGVQASATASSPADELTADDDSDDFSQEELGNQIFLPFAER